METVNKKGEPVKSIEKDLKTQLRNIQGHASCCCNQVKNVDVLALDSISSLHSRVHFCLPFICQENILVNKCLEADFLENITGCLSCVHLCLIQISDCPWNVNACVLLRLSGNSVTENNLKCKQFY